LGGSGFSVDEFYSVSVNDSLVLTLNFEVVRDQIYGASGHHCVSGFVGGRSKASTARRVPGSLGSTSLSTLATALATSWALALVTTLVASVMLLLLLVVVALGLTVATMAHGMLLMPHVLHVAAGPLGVTGLLLLSLIVVLSTVLLILALVVGVGLHVSLVKRE